MIQRWDELVSERFGGRLSRGQHAPESGRASALEALSVLRGIEWTDDPARLQVSDVHWLNDTFADDTARAVGMRLVAETLLLWPGWTESTRVRFARLVAARVIRDLLPIHAQAVIPSAHAWRELWDAQRLLLRPEESLSHASLAAAVVAEAQPESQRDQLLLATCTIWRDCATYAKEEEAQ